MPKSKYCEGKCSGKGMKLKVGRAAICRHWVSTKGLAYCGLCAIAENACQFCGKPLAGKKVSKLVIISGNASPA